MQRRRAAGGRLFGDGRSRVFRRAAMTAANDEQRGDAAQSQSMPANHRMLPSRTDRRYSAAAYSASSSFFSSSSSETTSPTLRPLAISTLSPLDLAELHVAALRLGVGVLRVGIFRIDEPDVFQLLVVLVGVDRLLGDDQRVFLVVGRDLHLAAHAGDDPVGQLRCP